MQLSSHKLKKLLISQEGTYKPEKQTKKSALKKFLIAYDVFIIFTAAKYREIPCEAEVQHRAVTLLYLQKQLWQKSFLYHF